MGAQRLRWRILVEGIVQGVGFRPFVYNLAAGLGLAGFVRNTAAGVLAEAEGGEERLETFVQQLAAAAPPLAVVESVRCVAVAATGEAGFAIRPSQKGEAPLTLVAPDVATCPECLRELLTPGDRRYRYPFINCTHCGPRYSIVRALPYDRPQTTMADFALCPRCRAEYDEPRDRRFHAQPNACGACGPAYRLVRPDGQTVPQVAGEDVFQAARRLVAAGAVLALKGIGGYHLVCDARREEAVRRLRQRKGREGKPLAVMCRDADQVRRLCLLSPQEERLLSSPARPIVLLPKGEALELAASVAPGNPCLGVMLPYAPPHWLLLEAEDVWVMTSGNRSGEPMVKDDDAALAELAGMADYFLQHNRPIHCGVDDSVARVVAGQAQLLRRSRGYAPRPIRLPGAVPPLLAAGGELKNAFCLARGDHAFVSPHVGDLGHAATYDAYAAQVAHLEGLFGVRPEAVAYDPHPAYLAGRYARQRGLPLVAVQHHHAHAAAVMAEHALAGPVLALAFDGAGYGEDGRLWGGEFLLARYGGYRRLAHLAYRPLPGGEQAVRQPWRLAAWAWYEAFGEEALRREAPWPPGWQLVVQAARAGLGTPLTSSAGRLFDTAAALLGVCGEVHYEGQAALELEGQAAQAAHAGEVLPWQLRPASDRPWQLDLAPLLAALAAQRRQRAPVPWLAACFHATLAAAAVETAHRLAQAHGLRQVVLGGGVWQNALLLQQVLAGLAAAGLEVFLPRQLPFNDGGLAYGQAAVAGARLRGDMV